LSNSTFKYFYISLLKINKVLFYRTKFNQYNSDNANIAEIFFEDSDLYEGEANHHHDLQHRIDDNSAFERLKVDLAQLLLHFVYLVQTNLLAV